MRLFVYPALRRLPRIWKQNNEPLRQENLSLPKLFRILLVCLSVYLLWALLVFLMYIFSMPEEEALRAASFYRYNGTGLGFVMGLIAIIFFSFFGRKNLPCPAAIRTLSVLCLAFIVMFLAVSPLDMSKIPFAKRIFERRTELGEHRAGLISAHAEYNLPNGGTFLAYCKDNDTNQGPFYEYYHVKYEFETANIYMIAESDGMYLAGTKDDKELYTDPSEFIADTIDGCEAFFVMDESPDFQFFLDSFLETYTGDTPVIYTYKY